jgi:hypothetical protein
MDELTRRRIRKQLYTVLGRGAPLTISCDIVRPELVEELVDELSDEWSGEEYQVSERVLRRQRVPAGVLIWRSPEWDDLNAV